MFMFLLTLGKFECYPVNVVYCFYLFSFFGELSLLLLVLLIFHNSEAATGGVV